MKHKIEECIGSRLRALSRAIDAIYRKNLAGKNITENQLSILMLMYKIGEIEQIEVARFLNLEKSSLSRNLRRLIEQKLVEKSGPVNRPVISLTNKGRELVEELLPLWERSMDEIYQMLGDDAIQAFDQFEKGFK